MEYNVSFYNDLVDLLTERNANFVNKLKALSTKITNAIGKKVGGQGTTGRNIINFLATMVENGEDEKTIQFEIPDWVNPAIDNFPNTGKPIPIIVKFRDVGSNGEGVCKFSGEGGCYMQGIRGQVLISKINIRLDFAISPDQVDKSYSTTSLLIELQRIIVHEIAHAHDKLGHTEWSTYKKSANSSNDELKYLHYWLKPTEIRSHMNEMIHFLSSTKHHSPKRTFKNMYKTADKAREVGMDFTDEQKDMQKRAFSMLNKHNASQTTDKLSYETLTKVLNNAWINGCAKSLKKFIITYHISFIRDSHPTMKQRYYDKYFPNTDVPSLDSMNAAYEAIQTIYRTLTRLQNDIKKHYKYDRLYDNGDRYYEALQEFHKLEDNILDTPPLSDAIEQGNAKLIKKASKQIIENFREEQGYLTKSMMMKQYKNSSGLEDFFNSDPSSVR